jgi:hypothetical protein
MRKREQSVRQQTWKNLASRTRAGVISPVPLSDNFFPREERERLMQHLQSVQSSLCNLCVLVRSYAAHAYRANKLVIHDDR